MRLLVISNSCLSEEESNGRILRTLLSAYSNEELSNFAIRGIPNCDGVDYMTVTDHDALRSFMSLGIKKPQGVQRNATENSAANHAKSQSAFNHCVRDVVWFSNFWKRDRVKQWINSLDVSAVFLMAADAPFLYRLARKISEQRKIPLIIYSSEDYFLKRYNYMERKTSMNLWCKSFLHKLHKEAKKAFQHASLSMLCSKKLEQSVKDAYGDIPTQVIYQPSTIQPLKPRNDQVRKVLYGGNIPADRASSLIEVSNAIHAHNNDLYVDVYGSCSSEVENELLQCSGIRYHGKIPYSALLDTYKETDLLIHVEGSDPYHLLDYAHAFSTKIGDCYQSGIPFFMYGPASIPCIDFGVEACPAYTATSKEDMEKKIAAVLDGTAVFNVDRSFLNSCFDASIVSKKIAGLISDLAKSNQ